MSLLFSKYLSAGDEIQKQKIKGCHQQRCVCNLYPTFTWTFKVMVEVKVKVKVNQPACLTSCIWLSGYLTEKIRGGV